MYHIYGAVVILSLFSELLDTKLHYITSELCSISFLEQEKNALDLLYN